ncbi:Nucleic acid binding,zinc ion binding,DNA binding, putative isoform 1 [Hibiscus syriacus]|uniref:Nucleic acid binding,zinc ion binding,DNA binding, putative isoform 1 n=1 Tax=Hibiscus syriacus TaxID=106335 RepID=A0A6A3A2Z0_HIBSY|nr:Nucleic acid binding,zinc ion binding,DNA binding, putative isoform 1 [Hibiscus syriacus]
MAGLSMRNLVEVGVIKYLVPTAELSGLYSIYDVDCLLIVMCLLLLGFGVCILEGMVRGLIWLMDDDGCVVVLWTGWSSSSLCVGRGGFLADLWKHIASECTTKSLCWNCREPGHTANHCPNEGICHTCGKSGHRARDCTAPPMPPGDVRLCNNCYKPGHIAVDCTNDKACNNCRRPGHLAHDCANNPICNLCNVAGHMARNCPKANMIGDRGIGSGRGGGYLDHRDIMCHNCHRLGHMSRDCMGALMICNNCGGRGHMVYECP